MADGDADLKVRILAELQELREGMAEGQAVVRAATDAMRGDFRELGDDTRREMGDVRESMKQATETISSGYARAKAAVAGLLGILGGGAAFREIIEGNQNWAFSVELVARRLGIGTQEASAWVYATRTANTTVDTVASSAANLAAMLNKSDEAFQRNRIAVRDAQGALLPLDQILLNTIRRYGEIRAGTDQALFATQMFKRSVGSMPELQRFAEDLGRAREEVKALGLELGPDQVTQARAFEDALDTTTLAVLGVTNAFAEGLKPALRAANEETARLIRDGNVRAWGEAAGAGVRGLMTVVREVKAEIAAHWELVTLVGSAYVGWRTAVLGMSALSTLPAILGTIATGWWLVAAALTDTGVALTIATGGLNLVVPLLAAGTVAVMTYTDSWRSLYRWITDSNDALANFKPLRAPDMTGMMRGAGGPGQPGSFDVRTWVTEGQVVPPRLPGTGGTDTVQPVGKPGEGEGGDDNAFKALQREQAAALQAVRDNAEERLRIVTATTEAVKARFGEESEFFAQQMIAQQRAQEDARQERTRIAQIMADTARGSATAELDLERDKITTLRNMGLLSSSEALARLDEITAARHAVILNSLETERLLYANNAVALAQIDQKVAEEHQRYAQATFQLETDRLQRFKAVIDTVFGSVTRAVDRSVLGMVQGTLKFRQAMSQAAQSIVVEWANAGIRMVFNWARDQAAKLIISIATDQAEVASTAAATAEKTAIEGAGARKSVFASAASAAGKAADAVASIPYVGPVLAAIAYAGTYALVLGGLSVISAERGAGEVPADGTMAVLHKKEMVLPAPIANAVREMADGRTGGGIVGSGAEALRFATAGDAVGFGARRGVSATGPTKPMPVTAAQPLGVTNDGGSPIRTSIVRSQTVETQPASGARPTPVDIVKGMQKVEVANPAGRPVFVQQVQMAGGMIAEVSSMGQGYGIGGGGGAGGGGSFAGGGEVDRDMIARLHFREMVLSPEHAEKIRNLPDARDGAVGRTPPVVNNYNITAFDAQDVDRFLKKHRRAVFKATQAGAKDSGHHG